MKTKAELFNIVRKVLKEVNGDKVKAENVLMKKANNDLELMLSLAEYGKEILTALKDSREAVLH